MEDKIKLGSKMLVRIVLIIPEVSFFHEENPVIDFFKLAMIWNLLFLTSFFDFSDQSLFISNCLSTFEWICIFVAPALSQIDHFESFENSFPRTELNSPFYCPFISLNFHIVKFELKCAVKVSLLCSILKHP